jgi:hypothetical protein
MKAHFQRKEPACRRSDICCDQHGNLHVGIYRDMAFRGIAVIGLDVRQPSGWKCRSGMLIIEFPRFSSPKATTTAQMSFPRLWHRWT